MGDSSSMDLDLKLTEQLTKFRQLLKDFPSLETKEDKFLARWIRARDGNLEAAVVMLKKSLEWRLAENINDLMNWTPPDIFSKLCPLYFLGCDRDTFPVLFVPLGEWNLREVVAMDEKETFTKFIDWILEQVETCSMKSHTGYSISTTETQIVIVLDFEQFSVLTMGSIPVLDMILKIVKRLEANHPEIMKSIYVINAGKLFTMLLALVRPLLSERTFGKVKIFGTNKDVWIPAITEIIPIHILPPKYRNLYSPRRFSLF